MPIARLQSWLEQAKATESIKEPTAMTLATVGPDGQPSARIVLVKEISDAGLTFFTNLESRKSREIKTQPKAALCFYWEALDKQVRVEGSIAAIAPEQSDAYFATRPREKQIGAWASVQSQPMATRDALDARIAEVEKQFAGKPVPRPAHWGGWRLSPARIEFWVQRDFRLHVREAFTRDAAGNWQMQLLYP